jgi:hypothetical protein
MLVAVVIDEVAAERKTKARSTYTARDRHEILAYSVTHGDDETVNYFAHKSLRLDALQLWKRKARSGASLADGKRGCPEVLTAEQLEEVQTALDVFDGRGEAIDSSTAGAVARGAVGGARGIPRAGGPEAEDECIETDRDLDRDRGGGHGHGHGPAQCTHATLDQNPICFTCTSIVF